MADTDFDEYHIHQCILYEFNKGSSALQAKKNICSVYMDAVTVSECQQLFSKFKKGEWDFADQTTDSEKAERGKEENKIDPLKKPLVKKAKEVSKKHKSSSSPNEKNLIVKKKKSKEGNLPMSDNDNNKDKDLSASPKDSSVVKQNNENGNK